MKLRLGGNRNFTGRSFANALKHVVKLDTPSDKSDWPSAASDTVRGRGTALRGPSAQDAWTPCDRESNRRLGKVPQHN